jgi:thiol-disulfide isomerase/thioredoxin
MKYFLSVLLIAATLIFVGCGSETEKAEGTSNRGDAPKSELTSEKIAAIENATFTDFEGNEFSISDFHGKTVLIDFWETWCAPCITSMPTLDRLMKDYSDDFVVLATSPLWTDTKQDVKRFMDNNDYSFYFVHATDLANSLSIRGIPYKVYVGPDGKFYKDEAGSRGAEQDYRLISEVIERLRSGS